MHTLWSQHTQNFYLNDVSKVVILWINIQINKQEINKVINLKCALSVYETSLEVMLKH